VSCSLVIFLGGLSWNIVTLSLFFSDEVLSSLEGCLEAILESGVSGISGCLLLLSSFRFLGLESGNSLGLSFFLELSNNFSMLLGEWIESLHDGLVGQWVLLVLVVSSNALSNLSQLGLNLIGVNDSGDISAVHHWSIQSVSLLLLGDVGWGSEDRVEGLESVLGEDDESSEVTSWGELEDIESIHVASVNTWQVSGGLLHTEGVVSVDEEWTLSHDVSRVSVFSSSLSDLLGLSDLGEIVTSSEVLEGLEDGLGVWKSKVVNDKWELWDSIDVMTSSHDEWGASGGSEGGGNGMSSLSDVGLCVPFSPDLKWSEHSSLSAHVTESGLTSSGGTRSTDSWDSCDGSTSSPGLGGVLSASLVEDGMSLSSVLGQLRVNEMNKIVSDWGSEDTGHGDAVSDSFGAITLVD